jgi:hypothetical protein
MKSISFRTLVATAGVAVACLTMTPSPRAADVIVRPFQRFVAKTPFVGDPGSPGRVDIIVERYP